METSRLRPVRNFLGLRLTDVERATGVRADRLSQAERGLGRLTRGEFLAVFNFLRERLADELGEESPEARRMLAPGDGAS